MTTKRPKRYAIRRLNPFLGALEVVETDAARALSIDGVTWQIEVLTERPEHTWGSLNQRSSVKQFFRFGLWHPNDGMTRVPVNPVLDIGAMLRAAEALVAELPKAMYDLPFAFADRHELWLLDNERQPLALLASTTKRHFLDAIQPQTWQATLPAGTPFVSSTLTAKGINPVKRGKRRCHAETLESLVNGDAANQETQWFVRDSHGNGSPIFSSEREISTQTLKAQAFPITSVKTTWKDLDQRRLLDDYLDWLAPRLLTLAGLPRTLRERLEHAARAQAELVDANYRLYPEVINTDVIDSARVEARLRSAASLT